MSITASLMIIPVIYGVAVLYFAIKACQEKDREMRWFAILLALVFLFACTATSLLPLASLLSPARYNPHA